MDNEKELAAEQARKVRKKKELEYQYSPSKWSKRLDSGEVIQAHVKLCSAASQKAKESIPYEVLRYGKGENQEIDLFGPSKKDSQVLVYVHGGYWQDLDRAISSYIVEPLVRNGIRAAIVGYDLAPNGCSSWSKYTFSKTPLPKKESNYLQQNNLVKLDRIVEEMKELDTFLTSWATSEGVKHIWYAGHSAGAYLIATILKNCEENRIWKGFIDGMIFISGVYNLVPLVDTYVNDKLRLTRDEAQYLSLTKMKLKNCQKIKVLVVVAENDSHEFIKQSQQFHQTLAEDIPDCEYLMIKEKDHFDVVEKLNDEGYELTRKIIDMISENAN